MKKLLLFIAIVVACNRLNAQNPMVVSECDFDGVVNNCEFSFHPSLQNTWQIGTPQKPFFGNAYSAPNAIQTDSINAYPANNYSEFTLKFANNVVDATDWTITMFSFWHKYQTDFLNDFGAVAYSLDDGSTWLPMVDTFNIFGSNGYSYEYFYWDVPLMETPDVALSENRLSGISSGWVFSKYSWLWYLPVEGIRDLTPDTILVRFNFTTDGTMDNYDGWIIDNFSVEKASWGNIQDPANISDDLHLFPNPVTDKLNFALSGNENPLLQQVINQHGEVVRQYSIRSKQAQISVNDLPKGNYLFKVITADGHFAMQQMVVQ